MGGVGGEWEKGPEKGIQAHEWRRSEHVPTRTVPGRGLGCPETPGKGGPAWGSSRLSVCECARGSVRGRRACSSRRAFSASRGGRRWRDLPSVCGGRGSRLGARMYTFTRRGGGQLSGHSAALSQLAQHQWVTTACRGPREGEGCPQPQQQRPESAPREPPQAHQPEQPRFWPLGDWGHREARPFCSSRALPPMQQGLLGTRGAGRGAGGCPGAAGGPGPAPQLLPGRGAPASSRTGATCPCPSGAF